MIKKEELGREIVALRKQRCMTQEKLALESEISTLYMRRIERGEANPTIEILSRVAAILDKELTIHLIDREDMQ